MGEKWAGSGSWDGPAAFEAVGMQSRLCVGNACGGGPSGVKWVREVEGGGIESP